MKQFLSRLNRQLYAALGSRVFFSVILGLFGISAAFVALTSLYPMAFDEDFHLGIIKIYAAHPLPWGFSETRAMAKFGNVPHDTSWLFHWLMSFPYNFFHTLGLNETTIIFCLRFINIALFVVSAIVMKKILQKTGLTRAITNLIIIAWLLIPISSQIAGQINYDNLLLLIFVTATALAQTILSKIKQLKIPLLELAWLAIVLLLGTATKYAFLPVLLGMGLVIAVALWRSRHFIMTGWKKQLRTIPVTLLILTSIVGIFSIGVNYRYVSNLFEFRTINPSCDATFATDDCLQYGVYARNKNYIEHKSSTFHPKNPVNYFVSEWIPGLTQRLFFAVAGPTNHYDTRQPAIIPLVTYCFMVGLGLLAALIHWKITLRTPYFWLLFLPMLLYILALFVDLYDSYRETGVPVALNGRYLVPFIPIVAALCFKGLQKFNIFKPYDKVIVTVILLIIATTGGGTATYIVQSKPNWFYSGAARNTTTTVRNIARPFTPTF